MSDALVEAALSAAPLSIVNTAFEILSPSSTFPTSTQKPTSTGSHHAATINAVHELVRDADEERLSGQYLNTVRDIGRRNETLLRGIRLGIGFGAAVFALLLIGAVYVGIRCCRKKPSDEEDNSSMEISGVQYEMREEYGPKPMSRCSTCDTDAVRAESSLRADSGMGWSDRPSSQDIIEREAWKRDVAGEGRATVNVVNSV